MTELLKRFVKEEDAPTAVEYAIMLVCVALVVITFGQGIGNGINAVLAKVQTFLNG